jgi:hypothetical protein
MVRSFLFSILLIPLGLTTEPPVQELRSSRQVMFLSQDRLLRGVGSEYFDSEFAQTLFLRKIAAAPQVGDSNCEPFAPVQYDNFTVASEPTEQLRVPLQQWRSRARSGDFSVLAEVESVSPGLNVQRLLATNVVTVRVLRKYVIAKGSGSDERLRFLTNSGRLEIDGKVLCVRDEKEPTFAPGQRLVITGYRIRDAGSVVATDTVRSVLLVSPRNEVAAPTEPSLVITLERFEELVREDSRLPR